MVESHNLLKETLQSCVKESLQLLPALAMVFLLVLGPRAGACVFISDVHRRPIAKYDVGT